MKSEQIYQFKITLKDIKPPIWRRILIPANSTFWELHVAIQDAMGWTDTHLHEFEVKGPDSGDTHRIGIPDDEFGRETLPGWKVKTAKYCPTIGTSVDYMYDFGDGWEHKIKLEKILPREEGADYPDCIAGERACPPEDCGGPDEYVELLEAISDENHEEHEEMLEWLGGGFDPEAFDPNAVTFTDAEERLKFILEDE
ncbi:plasmid pRiA4b ORF-3 family protein [candidate division WOR-3 bacterium]|uniref:Plasmid pRiA4b ORF-3 family protein n=1 Tax=candidate division WOR-3 bacterium TaxID=2052148 RepID=A0A9D5KAN5_UNCW3|nr:plasmid pRiA4b ORF-3 family protein [candidate division WOR-3 bacterium]MBD3364341.1 plasmid pRiA4b ORF-3 family protein [candidate division WOR-3 bacterium]